MGVGEGSRGDRLRELLDAVVDADNTDVGDMARSNYASEFSVPPPARTFGWSVAATWPRSSRPQV
jgi:hypothetical protein